MNATISITTPIVAKVTQTTPLVATITVIGPVQGRAGRDAAMEGMTFALNDTQTAIVVSLDDVPFAELPLHEIP